MVTPEHILPIPPEGSIQAAPTFTEFEDSLKRFITDKAPLVDYVISGDAFDRRVYIFPTFSVKDEIGNIQDDPILDMALDLETVLNDDAIYTREFGGDFDNRKYYFPRFRITSDDSEQQLVCVIYPSKTYAEKVREADVLDYEKHRSPVQKTREIENEILRLRSKYPQLSIPMVILEHLLRSE